MANWRLVVILVVALLLAVAAVIYAEGIAAQPAEARHEREHGRFRVYYNPAGTGWSMSQTFLLDVETGDSWQAIQTNKSNEPMRIELSWRKMSKD